MKLLLQKLSMAMALAPLLAIPAYGCLLEKTCKQMESCAEAAYYLNVCGHGKRDGDGDGIPCESICGKTQADYQRRRSSVTFTPGDDVDMVPQKSRCSGKTTCNQMDSCSEAQFYLSSCGTTRLDGDNDGIPCESLCR